MYNIRSKEGVLKARVSNSVTNKIIDNVDGFFREAIYKTETKVVYEVRDQIRWVQKISVSISGKVVSWRNKHEYIQ